MNIYEETIRSLRAKRTKIIATIIGLNIVRQKDRHRDSQTYFRSGIIRRLMAICEKSCVKLAIQAKDAERPCWLIIYLLDMCSKEKNVLRAENPPIVLRVESFEYIRRLDM